MWPFDPQAVPMPCIVARDDLGNEVSPVVQLIEVMTATQQQGSDAGGGRILR